MLRTAEKTEPVNLMRVMLRENKDKALNTIEVAIRCFRLKQSEAPLDDGIFERYG